jgi:uncharacterized protein with PIN domain
MPTVDSWRKKHMKFVCDQMFGTLAKWLRLCGFDTYYEKENINDDDILEVASREHRVILSRDRELILRAEKRRIPAYPIQSHEVIDQLVEVLSKTNQSIDETFVFSRCSVCNHLLQPVGKKDVIDLLPPKVAETKETYWQCPSCERVYWQGTHYEKIKKTILNIEKKLQ